MKKVVFTKVVALVMFYLIVFENLKKLISKLSTAISRSCPDMSTSLIKRLVVVVRIGRDLDSNDFANPSAMGFAS